MSEHSRTYFPKLDGLRAIAILLVLVHHFGGFLAGFFDAGYYGVDLFFVISGYLITCILLASTETFGPAYKTFLGRRTLRIFPVYYLALAAMYVLSIGSTRSNIGYLTTYTWNYASQHTDSSEIFYLWSLSVEEQFYLFWPFLVLLLRNRLGPLLVLTLIVVAIGYGQLMANIFPALSPYNYTGLINRMGSLGTGALGAVLIRMGRLPKNLFQHRMIEFIILCLLVWSQITEQKIRFPLMGICSLFLVLKCVHGDFKMLGFTWALEHKAMQYIGRISYGIYVYHVPIGVILGAWIVEPIWMQIPFENLGILSKLRWHSWLLKLPFYSGAAVLLASISFRWFEKPILAKKDAWFAPRTKADAV